MDRLRPCSRYVAHYPDQTPFDGARIPKLEHVYDLVKRKAKPDFRLYVELKTALLDLTQSAAITALAEAAVALARRKGMTEQTTFVSFD